MLLNIHNNIAIVSFPTVFSKFV